MDMSENKENKHHHKRSKHSKHSKHSHSKRKHKHRHHHHHHHSKKKHHKHRSKVKLDERALLNALESLEADALDSIRVEVNKDPESGELLVSGSIQEEEEEVGGVADGSEDSDSSSSESEPEGGQTQTEPEKKIVDTDMLKTEEFTIHAMSSRTDSGGSIPLVHHFESKYSVSLTNESKPEIFSGNGTQLESSARDSKRVEEVRRASSSEVVENLALKKDLKTIRINIQRKSLLSETKETDLESDLKVENGQTMTVTTGDTKITYVNLKNEELTAGSASGNQVGNSDSIPIRDYMKSGSTSEVEFSSESDTEREKQKSRDHSAVKHHKAKSKSAQRSRRPGRSRSWSQSRSLQRSHRHGRSRSRSRSKSPRRSHRRERSRSWSQSKSPQRSHRHGRSRSRSRSKSPRRSHRHERSRSRSRSRSLQRSHRHGRSRSRSRSKSPRRSHRRERSRSRSRSRSLQRSHKHGRSRSRSRSKSPRRSHRHGRSRSRSRSRSPQKSHRRERSRSRSQSRSLQRSHRHGRSRSRSQSKSPRRSHRHGRSRSRSQSRSPQRSHRRERSRSRSRSRSLQRSHRHGRSRSSSQSKSLQRSHRRERSRSRSLAWSPRRSRRHGTSRSRSQSKSPRRSRRRERSRSRSRSKSPQRSHRHGRSRSRSRSRTKRRHFQSHSHSRVPYHSRRRDSCYRSPRRHYSSMRKSRRRHSRSRSRHHERSHSRSRSYSKGSSNSSSSRSRSPSETRTSARDTTTSSSVAMGTVANATDTASVTDTSDPKQAHIAHLTALCKQLQQKQAIEDEMPPEERKAKEENEDIEEMQIRAPFNVAPTPSYEPGLIFHNNVWKTPNQLVVESNVETEHRPVEEKFPVSAGLDHQKTENYMDAQSAAQSINVFARFQPVSVGDLVVKRLEATRTLQENPADFTALQTLAYIEEKAQVWAESHKKPGQFTGQRALTALSKVEHNTGVQAWAKKKMFHGLPPVMSGFGMKMLKKMGWQEGQPLGKMGEGYLEPIAVDVKVDRSGLSTEMDKQPPIVSATALQSTNSKSSHLVHGKHPVSALQEICAKKHWDPPHYELLELGGPAHKKNFLYKVSVPLGTFQPAVASPSKKQAKAQAATACLQGLGFFGDSAVTYTAS